MDTPANIPPPRSTAFSAKKDIVRESALPLHPELERVLKAWLEERNPVGAGFKTLNAESGI